MKNTFVASLLHSGILGGVIYTDDEKAAYRTNKLTVAAEYRDLQMPYADMAGAERGRFLFLPTVRIKMKDGREHRFLVFGEKRFREKLREHGVA